MPVPGSSSLFEMNLEANDNLLSLIQKHEPKNRIFKVVIFFKIILNFMLVQTGEKQAV